MSYAGHKRGGYGLVTLSKKARSMPLGVAVAKAVAKRNRAPRIKGSISPKPELKYVDTALTAGTHIYGTTGLATPINLLAVGDDNTTRDGRQVTIKSVQIKGVIRPLFAGAAVSYPSRCRSMLIWDNANNSVATSSATLIAAALTAATSYSFPLVNNQERFTILWDSAKPMGYMDNDTYGSNSPGCQVVDFYKKLNCTAQYSGTTAVIESIQNGALWFVTLGDQADANAPVFYGNARVRFTDQ